MPNVEWNHATWDGRYDWSRRGEEWSAPWGSSEAQWFGCLYPRVRRFLPAKSVLEIGPGFGRWTRFLIPLTESYLGVDLSAQCVTACRERFRDVPHAVFHRNDGTDLSIVPDGSVDLAFSFDSLVHADLDVLTAYLKQLVAKLAAGAVGFIHHSNVAATSEVRDDLHHRAVDVSHALVDDAVEAAGGRVLIQELLAWSGTELTDCISLFCRRGDFLDRPKLLIENQEFMTEAGLIRRHVKPYALSSS